MIRLKAVAERDVSSKERKGSPTLYIDCSEDYGCIANHISPMTGKGPRRGLASTTKCPVSISCSEWQPFIPVAEETLFVGVLLSIALDTG